MSVTLTKEQEKEQEIANAKSILKSRILDNETIYCIIRKVSASGMPRVIDLFVINPGDNGIDYIGKLAAKATGMTYNHKIGGVFVKGCGMDMAYHLVSSMAASIGLPTVPANRII